MSLVVEQSMCNERRSRTDIFLSESANRISSVSVDESSLLVTVGSVLGL